MISAIAAVDENYAIGYKGQMLISIPDDLKMFRATTTGHVIVMGRKTFECLPVRPLPNRKNIVVTSSAKDGIVMQNTGNGSVYFTADMQHAISEMEKYRADNHCHCFVIGGGEVYRQLLPYCERLYLTRIYKAFEQADVYFPNISKSSEWKMLSCSPTMTYGDVSYQFCIYEK